MNWTFNDGGRAAAGYTGAAGDCATRAVAIATGLPYEAVYRAINRLATRERSGSRKRGRSNAREGVFKATMQRLMQALGWGWTPTMGIGTGCRVHLRAAELPGGRLIAAVSKHYVAVVDGTVRDTHDPSRDGTRCVYGYWTRTPTMPEVPIEEVGA